MKFVDAMRGALAKAQFTSSEVMPALEELLSSHNQDLNDVGYEPSTDTEEAIKSLNNVLNEMDEAEATRMTELAEAIKEGRELEDDDTNNR